MGKRLGIEPFGYPRESFNIGKKDGKHFSLTAQLQAVGMLDDLFNDIRTQILLEGILDEHLLPPFGGVIDQPRREKRNGNTRFLHHQRHPESPPVSDQTKNNRRTDE